MSLSSARDDIAGKKKPRTFRAAALPTDGRAAEGAARGSRPSCLQQPVRSRCRHVRSAVHVLLGLAALVFAAPEVAQAQTVTTLLSNAGQRGSGASPNPGAQAFTTGDNAAGYGLTSVDVYVLRSRRAVTPLVEIFENFEMGDLYLPGRRLATLLNPATITTGSTASTFTAPANIELSPNTIYWLVVRNAAEADGTGFPVFIAQNTTADDGAATGWSIGIALTKNDIRRANWSATNLHTIFTVKGTANMDTGTAQPSGAPTSLRATPGNGQVTLRWMAPTETGGALITHYEYEQDGDGTWITTGGPATTVTVTGLTNGRTYMFRVRAVNQVVGAGIASDSLSATPRVPPDNNNGGGGGGGGGSSGPTQTVPGVPTNLMAMATDGQVTLTWDAPEDDGGTPITDYEYRINGTGNWTSAGSTETTYTVTGLDNDTEYTFEVRAVNRIGRSQAPDPAEAAPRAAVVLDFAHFANGAGTTSGIVLVNVAPYPIQPTLYFSDTEGNPIAADSVVDIKGNLMVAEDGSLSVSTAMAPLDELTIRTHGRGELVSGSVRVASGGPIGGLLRYSVPGVGVAGVGASPPVRDAIFPARRQEGGIRTAAAIHNLEAEAMGVNCRLISATLELEEVEILLEANGQTARFIDDLFTGTGTSDFVGSVRCTASGRGRFTAVAVEMDAANRIFTTLPVVRVDHTGGRGGETVLDFAHFANGTWITDLVFVNPETRPSGPALTPFHTAIPPSRPVIYFYDTAGNPMDPASAVDITDDLEITEDGALTVRTEMEPLGVLTISTHGRGGLVSGSVKVVSEGPIGGMLRFGHPDIGVAGVGASTPVGDAIVPVRRQEGGITTGVALHNLGSSPELVRCELRQAGVLLDAASIPLEANGQTAWFIDATFPDTDTSDFSGSVRCSATGEGLFTGMALEMDLGNRIFTTLPVVPIPERMSRE